MNAACAAGHSTYGTVTVDTWTGLHAETCAAGLFSVVRVQVEHLPRHPAPQPPWLAWVGGPLPADLLDVWRWYLARFTVEHRFRFVKQRLGWTTPRLRGISAHRGLAGHRTPGKRAGPPRRFAVQQRTHPAAA